MTVGIFLEDGVEARICAEIAARQKRGIAHALKTAMLAKKGVTA